jgi:hypothetical protein
MRLIVRWYHEDKLILERQDLFGPGLNYTWIERQTSADFEEGMYKLDVAGHTIQFRVEKASKDDNARLLLATSGLLLLLPSGHEEWLNGGLDGF